MVGKLFQDLRLNKQGKLFLCWLGICIGGILIILPFILADGPAANSGFNKTFIKNATTPYGKVIVTNSTSAKKIIEVDLLNNTDICLINCSAEGSVYLYEKGKLIDSLKFTKLEYKRWVPYTLSNYTIFIKSGKDWIIYKNQDLDIGLYNFKIEGKIGMFDVIDWVGTWKNVEITDWATWTSSLSIGLIGYYDMENKAEKVLGMYNLTNWTKNQPQYIAGGLIGKGLQLAQTYNARLPNGTLWNFNTTQNLTFNFWVKLNATMPGGGYFICRCPDDIKGYMGVETANHLYVHLYWTGTNLTAADLVNNKWYMITYTTNDTSSAVWLNGSIIGTGGGGGMLNFTDSLYFQFGDTCEFTGYADGMIDEVSLWNRSLNGTEIFNQLYNTGLGLTYIYYHPPLILFNATIPAAPILNSQNVFINVTLNDTEGDDVYINFTILSPNSTFFLKNANGMLIGGAIKSVTGQEWHSGFFNISLNTSSLGVWKWNYTIYENTSTSVFQSGNFSIKDTNKPNVTLIFPATNSILLRNVSLNLNFSVIDELLESCWYSTDEGITNVSLPLCNNATFSIAPNSYNITLWANDTSNNLNSSKVFNVTFFYDNVKPNLTINAPNTTYSGITYIPVNITALDNDGISNCYFNITRGASLEVLSTRIDNCANTTFIVSGNAVYVIHILVNDTTGNINISEATFTTTSYIPPPVIITPGGGGGGIIEKLIPEKAKICEPAELPFSVAWANFNNDKSFENLKNLWYAFWDLSLCKSGASIIGVE